MNPDSLDSVSDEESLVEVVWFRWYPAKWRAHTDSLGRAQKGTLLDVYGEALYATPPCTIADTSEAFDRLLGKDRDSFEPMLRAYFKPMPECPERLRSAWLFELWKEAAAFIRGRKKGGTNSSKSPARKKLRSARTQRAHSKRLESAEQPPSGSSAGDSSSSSSSTPPIGGPSSKDPPDRGATSVAAVGRGGATATPLVERPTREAHNEPRGPDEVPLRIAEAWAASRPEHQARVAELLAQEHERSGVAEESPLLRPVALRRAYRDAFPLDVAPAEMSA